MSSFLKALILIVLTAVLFICVFYSGFYVGQKIQYSFNTQDNFTSLLDNLPEGSSIIYEIEEYKKGESSSGTFIEGQYDTTLARILSPFGTSAINGIKTEQGIQIDGYSVSVGATREHPITAAFLWIWNIIKKVLFLVLGSITILVVLLFIPATATVAGGILRFFASLIPGLGALIENLISKKRTKESEEQKTEIINGGQNFKNRIAKSGMSEQLINKILKYFTEAHLEEQSKKTQKIVKNKK